LAQDYLTAYNAACRKIRVKAPGAVARERTKAHEAVVADLIKKRPGTSVAAIKQAVDAYNVQVQKERLKAAKR
jgi:hypothetical protein